MNPVDRKLIDLAIIGKHRCLTVQEAREWEESRQYVINRAWKHARIMNLMKLARDTRDWDWVTELTAEYEKVKKLF